MEVQAGFPEEVILGLRMWREEEELSPAQLGKGILFWLFIAKQPTTTTLGGLKQLFYFEGQGLGKGSAGPPGVG